MTDAASPKTQRRALAVRSPRHKAMLSKSARQCGDGRGTALTWCDPDLCGRTNPDATPIFALYQTLGVDLGATGWRMGRPHSSRREK